MPRVREEVQVEAQGTPGGAGVWTRHGGPTDQAGQRIADMLPESRPRERLEASGAESLTTPELLAILFRTGTAGQNAVQVAENLWRELGGMAGIAGSSLEELAGAHGIGRVKAIEVKAAIELGKRFAMATEETRPAVRGPADIAQLMMAELSYEQQERLVVLLLDVRNQVRHIRTVTVGTLTESLVHPREVFAQAIRHNAASIALVHNHPSGDPEPSAADLASTRRISEAGRLLGIELLDHVIIGDGRWVSLNARGML